MKNKIVTFVVAALVGATLAGALPLAAGSSHYEISDWSFNPEGYFDNNLDAASYFGSVVNDLKYKYDDPWDNVSGGWVNILALGEKDIPFNVNCSSVTYGEIWFTEYNGGSSGVASSCQYHNYLISQINRSRNRFNVERPLSDWYVSTANSLPPLKLDLLSAMIHETGHSMGMEHNGDVYTNPDVCLSGSYDDSNPDNIFYLAPTMCDWIMKWTGSGNVLAPQRTLRAHEQTDYANNY